jgi:hypothetical protein
MSSLYLLKPAVDTEETGSSYPAVQSYDDYNFKAYNSMHTLKAWEFPEHAPDIRFELAKGARLTDMLTQAAISGDGFLISEKLRNLFETLKMPPHRYYDATVEFENNLYTYYWLHIVWNDGVKFVNFPGTKFEIIKFSKIIGSIEISSYEDLKSKQKELGFIKMIYANQISMRMPNFDLFPVPINGCILATEKIKHQIEVLSPTGVLFVENTRTLMY